MNDSQPPLPPLTPEVPATDWQALATSLQQQNQHLLATIMGMEYSLTEAQKQAQLYEHRFAQQTAELQHSQGELELVNQELLLVRQALEQEQSEDKLLKTQQQVALLERELALLKEEHQHQGQQLAQAEKRVVELTERLQRRQLPTVDDDNPIATSVEVLPITPASEGSTIPPWSELARLDNTVSETEPLPLATPRQVETAFNLPAAVMPPKLSRRRPPARSINLPNFLRRPSQDL